MRQDHGRQGASLTEGLQWAGTFHAIGAQLIDRRLSVAGQVFDLIHREIVGSMLPPGMQIPVQVLST